MADDFYDENEAFESFDFWEDIVGYDENINYLLDEFMSPGVSQEDQQEILDLMAEYLDQEYDIVLDDVWDWDEFRAHY